MASSFGARLSGIGFAPLATALLLTAGTGPAATLTVEITPLVAGQALQPDSLRYDNRAGERFSITRASWLLSGFALQRADGSWLTLSNQNAWLDLEARRSSFHLPDVPPGDYLGVRFHVGPEAADNHADPARFPADHPLNPALNQLHWSWQGGYIFLALEGHWRSAAGDYDGWSFHLARDPNRTAINLAVGLALTNDHRLLLDFDLATLLNAPRAITFGKDGSSTHSRESDPLAAALVANLPGAFRVRGSASETPGVETAAALQPLQLPGRFTPHRFSLPATFPVPDLPRDNPLIEERVALGEALFRETALSRDGSLSCASCHDRPHAFADPRRFSVGVNGQPGARQAMPLFNLAWKKSFFWDGRAPSLRAQALVPIEDHAEMDESLTNVVAKLAATGARPPASNFPARFAAAFDSPAITPERIGLALEAFVLTLTSFDSKFDRAQRGEALLSEEEQRGFALFSTEFDPRRGQRGADCFHCHGGALFQSQSFANNGLDADPKDPGRAKVTGREADRGKFATPSLRNIALTAPYMHDGRFATLEEVVAHYTTGVKRSATLDPNLAKHPDGGVPLDQADQRALVAFLRTLTDEQFAASAR